MVKFLIVVAGAVGAWFALVTYLTPHLPAVVETTAGAVTDLRIGAAVLVGFLALLVLWAFKAPKRTRVRDSLPRGRARGRGRERAMREHEYR